jgi:hypothetical protein
MINQGENSSCYYPTNISTMKNRLFLTIGICVLIFSFQSRLKAQESKKSLTVLNIDSQGLPLNPTQMGNLLRIEVDRLDTFEVTDRYDVIYLLDKHNLDVSNCYGKICLVETGKIIGSELMLGGSVEKYGETIIVTLRLIDVEKGKIIQTKVMEFLDLPLELQRMLRIVLREMFNLPNNQELLTKLTKPYNFESLVTNPNEDRLNLSGPRIGATRFSGTSRNILMSPTNKGGYDLNHAWMFQFGYQFEAQYLNEGNMQALFEVIPMITGLDHNMFIPSVTILNGFRHNIYGIELAFGPSFNVVKKARGYYDANNNWNIIDSENPNPSGFDVVRRMDSRGEIAFHSSFVFAAGKSFKSGKMNIPVNFFFIPSKDGARFGISVGYNAKNKS